MLTEPPSQRKIAFEPWQDEYFHADNCRPRLNGERGANGQGRLARRYAAALAGSPLKSAQAVAERLLACAPDYRCGCGICPPCTWATNRWFRKAAATFADTVTAMLFSTVQVPDSRALPPTLDR